MAKEANNRETEKFFMKAYNFLLRRKDLAPAEKLVLIVIFRYWPNPYWDSNEKISNDLGFTERYIEKLIQRLDNKGIIKRGYAHVFKNGKPHTVRVIVPLCFSEKFKFRIKWVKTEQLDGQATEETEGEHPNNRNKTPEQSDDLLETNREENRGDAPPQPANGQALAPLNTKQQELEKLIISDNFGSPEFQEARSRELKKLEESEKAKKKLMAAI